MKRTNKNLSLSQSLCQFQLWIFSHDPAARTLSTFVHYWARMFQTDRRQRFLICDGVAKLLFAHAPFAILT